MTTERTGRTRPDDQIRLFDRSTALVVVDMQNIFIEPQAGHPNPVAGGVLQQVNALVQRADLAGSAIVYTRDYRPTDIPTTDRLCELHPDLDVRGCVVEKGPGVIGGFSGFVCLSPSEAAGPGGGAIGELLRVLQDARAERLVVCGLAADVCVAATAQDARRLGYEVVVAVWASAFVHAHPGGDAAALEELARSGVRVQHSPKVATDGAPRAVADRTRRARWVSAREIGGMT